MPILLPSVLYIDNKIIDNIKIYCFIITYIPINYLFIILRTVIRNPV